MHVCGLEKMSLVDYDGFVSATVFTGGCNFRCGFCHNSALVLSSNALPSIPQEDIFSYLQKRQGVLDAVCVSGGEPTLQKDLPLFLDKVKNLGYKIKLDTNGTAPNLIKSLYENGLVDYFAMDIKNDIEEYSSIIGIDDYDTKNVEKSVDFLLNNKAQYEFRTTLIKQFHKEDNIKNIAKWIKGADKYFLQKFKDSENCIKSHLSAVDDDTAVRFKELLLPFVPNTFLRGYGI